MSDKWDDIGEDWYYERFNISENKLLIEHCVLFIDSLHFPAEKTSSGY